MTLGEILLIILCGVYVVGLFVAFVTYPKSDDQDER